MVQGLGYVIKSGHVILHKRTPSQRKIGGSYIGRHVNILRTLVDFVSSTRNLLLWGEKLKAQTQIRRHLILKDVLLNYNSHEVAHEPGRLQAGKPLTPTIDQGIITLGDLLLSIQVISRSDNKHPNFLHSSGFGLV